MPLGWEAFFAPCCGASGLDFGLIMKRAAEALDATPAGERGEEEPGSGAQHNPSHEESEAHEGTDAEADALLAEEVLAASSASVAAEDEEGAERAASTSPVMVPQDDVHVYYSEGDDDGLTTARQTPAACVTRRSRTTGC